MKYIGRHRHLWRRFLRRDRDGGFVKCDRCDGVIFLNAGDMTKFNTLWNKGEKGHIRIKLERAPS